MALDKNDLLAIRTVIREEIKTEIEPLKKQVSNIDKRLTGVETTVSNIDKRLTGVETTVSNIDKRLSKLQKTVNTGFKLFDQDIVQLKKRVTIHDQKLNIDTETVTDPSRIF